MTKTLKQYLSLRGLLKFLKKLKFYLVLLILFITSMLYLGLFLICGFIDGEATREIMKIMLNAKFDNSNN